MMRGDFTRATELRTSVRPYYLTRACRLHDVLVSLSAGRIIAVAKNTMKLLVLAVLLVLAPIARSEGYGRDARLIGHWQYVENAELISEMTFREDGTFDARVMKKGNVDVSVEGKWLTRGKFLYYLYTKISPPRVPVGRRDKDTIVEIEKDYFVLVSVDHRVRKYVKDEP